MEKEIIKKIEEEIKRNLKIRNDYNDGVVDGLIIALKIIEKFNIID